MTLIFRFSNLGYILTVVIHFFISLLLYLTAAARTTQYYNVLESFLVCY